MFLQQILQVIAMLDITVLVVHTHLNNIRFHLVIGQRLVQSKRRTALLVLIIHFMLNLVVLLVQLVITVIQLLWLLLKIVHKDTTAQHQLLTTLCIRVQQGTMVQLQIYML